MPKTRHPKKYEKQLFSALDEVVDAAHFDTGVNPDRNDLQASITRLVTATGSVPLGTGGETKGFAKSVDPAASQKAGSRLMSGGFEVGGDCGLITRQVATCKADRFLGLNAVSEERYGRDANGQIVGISVQAEGTGVVSNKGVFQVDCRDPQIQRGLSDLEVSDFITGQTDRHSGNIFIDPTTGKVTGIDNDLSFPEKALDKVGAQARDRIVGMPKVMHEDTKAKILAADPEAFRKMLSVPPPTPGPSPLSTKAIDGAVGRLKQLQKELRKENSSIKVVSSFDDQTYSEALALQNDEFKKTTRDDTRGMHDYASLTEEDKVKLPVKILKSFDQIDKKSYLGTVELEMAKNKALPSEHVQPEHSTSPTPINRLPEVALEKKLATAYQRFDAVERRAFDREFERLNKMEASLETKQKHLVNPSVLDKLKAITMGMAAVKNSKQQHVDDLITEIQKLKATLEQQADIKIDPFNRPMPKLPDLPELPSLRSVSTSENSLSDDQGVEISGDGALSQSDTDVPSSKLTQGNQTEMVSDNDLEKSVLKRNESVLDTLKRQGSIQTKIDMDIQKSAQELDGDQPTKNVKPPTIKVGGF